MTSWSTGGDIGVAWLSSGGARGGVAGLTASTGSFDGGLTLVSTLSAGCLRASVSLGGGIGASTSVGFGVVGTTMGVIGDFNVVGSSLSSEIRFLRIG